MFETSETTTKHFFVVPPSHYQISEGKARSNMLRKQLVRARVPPYINSCRQLKLTSGLTEVDFSEMKQTLDFLPERMK